MYRDIRMSIVLLVADARGRLEAGASVRHFNYLGNYELCRSVNPTWERVILQDDNGTVTGHAEHQFAGKYCRVYHTARNVCIYM